MAKGPKVKTKSTPAVKAKNDNPIEEAGEAIADVATKGAKASVKVAKAIVSVVPTLAELLTLQRKLQKNATAERRKAVSDER